jgi:hypothetical protein
LIDPKQERFVERKWLPIEEQLMAAKERPVDNNRKARQAYHDSRSASVCHNN